MKSLDYWRLCDQLSVIQAALLIVGEDPSSIQYNIEHWRADDRPVGYEAAKTALESAINSEKIKGYMYYPESENTPYGQNVLQEGDPDLHQSKVYVDSLKDWLKSRGFTTGFFFPDENHNVPYLDENHPQYAHKLAVAILAWEEVSNNPYLLNNKSPKKALMNWLETNASKFELGTTAIEEIAKVANWQVKGGAPSTYQEPTPVKEKPYTPLRKHPIPPPPPPSAEIDDGIPF